MGDEDTLHFNVSSFFFFLNKETVKLRENFVKTLVLN